MDLNILIDLVNVKFSVASEINKHFVACFMWFIGKYQGIKTGNSLFQTLKTNSEYYKNYTTTVPVSQIL